MLGHWKLKLRLRKSVKCLMIGIVLLDKTIFKMLLNCGKHFNIDKLFTLRVSIKMRVNS